MSKKIKMLMFLSIFIVFALAWNVFAEKSPGFFSLEQGDEEGNFENNDTIQVEDEKSEGENSDSKEKNRKNKDEHMKEENEKENDTEENIDIDKENMDINEFKNEIIEKLNHFESPIKDASITRREQQLPGAPRAYRNGIHEGVDYYNGYVGVPIEMNTPVFSSAEGTVIRADHGYEELTPEKHEQITEEARSAKITPEEILDKLRGKQVWIKHEGGIVTRYAHLYSIPEDLSEGDEVEKGEHIGGVGNSGTSHGVEGTNNGAHLHFEIWLSDDYYLGKGMEPMESREILVEIFRD